MWSKTTVLAIKVSMAVNENEAPVVMMDASLFYAVGCGSFIFRISSTADVPYRVPPGIIVLTQ